MENSGGTASCEKTVEVLPIGDIAFSLPEYGYTDRAEDVKLLTKNDLTGSVVWTLMKDGANQPLASFTKEGGTLALAETGKYTLTSGMAAGFPSRVSSQVTASAPVSVVFTETESPTYRYAGRSKEMAGLSALSVNRTLLPLSIPLV